ncbi:MAG TPA: hypothetical protein DC049_12130 [Spirochaetia bacterium]|nr:hypothetical protein [Spirochaetia bacterium]
MLLNAADLIREHCSEHIKMSDIARKAGVGISWLSRSFTRAFGCGPAAFLSVSRISKARKLLVTTEFNLTRIALECGFYDSAHFIKCFKKRTGSNPLDFRRRYCNVRVKQNVF